MSETLYYLDDFSDEVMPCAPTLEAWAEWLAKPDPEFGREEPAEDGQTFAASVLIVLCDRKAVFEGGAWRWAEAPPEDADQLFLRPYEGATSWDADFSGDDLENAASGLEDWHNDGEAWFACAKSGDEVTVRFHADGPSCTVEPTAFRSACCEGEHCFCGAPADCKVEETIFHDDPTGWTDFAGQRVPARHPFTAYVCRNHFGQIMGPRAATSKFGEEV